jgi:salicylate hydroxylase
MAGLQIGICGAGVGGLCLAIALQKAGHSVRVIERAEAFARVGADVNLTPNAVNALDRLGVGQELRQVSARPAFRISRDGITGEETSRLPMSNATEEKYGAPQLTVHRADLLSMLEKKLPNGTVMYGVAVSSVTVEGQAGSVVLEDGSEQQYDVVIGADGIHSAVRSSLWGGDDPKFTGIVSYRSVVPRQDIIEYVDMDSYTKWWGEVNAKQISTFPLTQGREIFVFATTPQSGWTGEGWTLEGDVDELRSAFSNFHPQARAVLDACSSVTKSALHVREPMEQWTRGHITIMGDAAHPMMPFMAQGAAMAIEDAVVLGRSLENVTNNHVAAALGRYELARKARTAEVQRNSLANNWLREGGNADWVYGYDAWSAELR